MDPVTGLLLAMLFADLVTGGWVHSTLIGGATGAARETWADLSPRIPTKVKRSRAVRAGRAVGVGALYGGAAVARGVRTGVVPGVRAGHSRWRSQRHYWHRARDAWTRFRLWREQRTSRPVGGPAPAPTGSGPDRPSPGGGGPGGGRGRTPGPRTTTGSGTAATAPAAGGAAAPAPGSGAPPAPGSTPAPGREREPQPVAGSGSAPAPGADRPDLRLIPGGATATTGTTTDTTTDSSTPTSQEDTTVTTTTVDTYAPNTTTEDVPAHIQAGLDFADAVEDIAEQYTCALEDTVRRHITSAESIPGFPPSLQGQWEDDVAGPLSMVSALLKQAAEGARGAAEAERRALQESVDAADSAPADSDLSQSVLRSR